MTVSSPLPSDLLARYRKWKATDFADKAAHFETLGGGQNPVAMVISCCDSRVQSTEIFNVEAGSFFIHRNIANLVPAYAQDGDAHGTASALEYAVKALKVPHLIIMGHAQCGGVQACYEMCKNDVAAADAGFEFVGHWLTHLRPAHKAVSGETTEARLVSMGQQGVLTSLENLMGYPFIADAVAGGALHLHGLWHDFVTGTLYAYDAATGAFEAQ